MKEIFYNVGNDFYPEKLEGLVNLLKSGVWVRVGVDCIGHTRNNYTQEYYKEQLEKVFDEQLLVECSEGAYSYSYTYTLKNYCVVKRNGNYFVVKIDKHNHYYIATLLGLARITAWHRTTKQKIEALYEKVGDYTGEGDLKL